MPAVKIEKNLHLETEEAAWELLEALLDARLEVDELPNVTWGDWVSIDVYVPEDRYDSAITPYMMKGWVDLQRSIYRAYALAASGDADAKRLSDAEKDKLELVVEVKSGSSDQSVDTTQILTELALALVNKMEPMHVLIGLLVGGLTLGGVTVTKAWLNNRKEIKLSEIEHLKTQTAMQAQVAALQSIAAVAGVDRDRMNILAKAMEHVPVASQIEEEASKGREALVHHMAKQDAVVNGVEVKAEAGQSITRKTRIEASEVNLDGLYKIRRVDTSVATGFRVHVVNKDGLEIATDVGEVLTTLQDRDIIRDAEWSKLPVYLHINAKERRGEFIDARIIRARKFDPETDEAWE